MAQNLTRFIQLSDSILLEYDLNNEYSITNSTSTSNYSKGYINVAEQNSTILKTTNKTTGEIYLRYIDASILKDNTSGDTVDYDSNNHFYNSAFPMDDTGSEWFVYLNDGSTHETNAIDAANSWYDMSVGSIISGDIVNAANNDLPADTVKMHILSGYNLTDIFGFKLRITVPSSTSNTTVVLADWLYSRNQEAYNYEDALSVGNKIYDKYIRLEIPSVQYLISNKSVTHANDITNVLNVKPNCNISIEFSYISKRDYSSYYPTEYTLQDSEKTLFDNQYKFYLSTLFSHDITLNSNSDRFNLFISEGTSGNGNYFEFYSTWDGEPMTYERALSLNTTIPLYETKTATTDIDAIEITGTPWCVIHELTSQLWGRDTDGNNIKMSEEKFNYTQLFDDPTARIKFYYRPSFADIISNSTDGVSKYTPETVIIQYACRLVNRYDGTQYLRRGTLSTQNYNKYLTSVLQIPTNELTTYNIYNKIETNTQQISVGSSIEKTKYIKIYYNSSDIVINDNGNYYNSTSKYSLPLGNGAKNYKFTLKKLSSDTSTLTNVDFSIGSYVLYSRDANGNDITIPCTYSSNMNALLGELEFYISNINLTKLKAVPTADRFMSIMVINSNQEKSSVFEFTYNF